jgi:group II intron reverse transcriptase/maturase
VKETQEQEMARVYYTLYDKLLNYEHLKRSFKKVKAAKGGPGIDGQTIADFESDLEGNLTTLLRQLRDKSYQPLPVKESEIPKLTGGVRKLGIPTVRDRVVQQALKGVLQPIFEPEFHPSSYAYRPKRSQHHAIAKAALFIRKYEMQSVVDMDLAKCFDTLDHGLILRYFRERIADGSILELIRKFLVSGIMKGDDWRATTEGSPQGAVFSPLIANVYLNTFDQVMKERGHRIVRFADDIRIFKYSKSAAENALKQSKKILEKELRLKINTEKTKIVHASEGVDFLGVRIYPTHTSIQEKRLTRFKKEVKAKTKRNSSKNLQEIITELNPKIRGFANYFRIANCTGKFTKLMSWIRRRLRAKQLRLWKTKKKLRRRLRQRGYKAPDTCMRMGAWVSSNTRLAHQAMPNSFFHEENNLVDIAAVQTGIPVSLPEGIRVDMSRIRGP